MSNDNPDKDLNLDLHFLPSWAQESPEINRYSNYEGERRGRHSDRDRRGPRRSGAGDHQRGGRPGGDRSRGPRQDRDRQGGNRPQGRGRGPGPRSDRRGGNRSFEKRPEVPMPEVNLTIVPEERGVDLLTKQIRVTGRAYPLFDVARLVLQKEDRYRIEFSIKKNADGSVAQPIFSCALDDTLWLSEEDAVAHILDKHLSTFYEIKKTPTDPPKGTYTFVAQCGMSGAILGPPNYHDYQNKLRQLHSERFARLPFEKFKSRVKIVRDEEVVKKWLDEQSFKTEYVVLNVPEPLTLGSFEEVQKHFRETHIGSMVKSVEKHSVAGEKSRRVGSRELQRYVFRSVDEQKRFPLKLVTTLSQKFSTRGLQFFKVNKSVVHVAVARPHFLDLEATSVSDGVKKIVDYVNEHSRCSVKELVDFLAPTSESVTPAPVEPVPAPAESVDTAPAESAEKKPEHREPTDAQKLVLADLHWLVHEGHVIEFASGELETAKKPHPKPQQKKKAAPKPKTAPKSEASSGVAKDSTPDGAAVPDIQPGASEPSPSKSAAENAQSPSPESGASSEETESTKEAEPQVVRPVIDGSAVGDFEVTEPESIEQPAPLVEAKPETVRETTPSPEVPEKPSTEAVSEETGSDTPKV